MEKYEARSDQSEAMKLQSRDSIAEGESRGEKRDYIAEMNQVRLDVGE